MTKRPRRKPGEPAIAPFTVVVDTREQAPWPFVGIHGDSKDRSPIVVVPVVRDTLQTGDYSIRGYETKVCLERKSHQDLFQTLIYDWDRFKRELERMASFSFSAVVVEEDWRVISRPLEHSRIDPKSVIRRIYGAMIDFPTVQWLTMPTRRIAEITAFQLLRKFYERQLRKQQGEQQDHEQYSDHEEDSSSETLPNPTNSMEVAANVDFDFFA